MVAVTTSSTSRPRSGERGFTIAEVVLVVFFVVLLLVIATTAVRGIRRETSASNCQTERRTLKLATEEYHSQNDAYPVDKSVLVDGGLVDADDIANYTVEFTSADRAPTFRAIGDCA